MKIRTRIFLVFFLIASASLGALVYWITTELRPRYLEAHEESIVDTAYLLAELLRDELRSPEGTHKSLAEAMQRLYDRRFSADIYELERQQVDIRIYLTDSNGVVVFDSAGKDIGADYSRWNDVHRALRGEYGARSTADDPADPEATTSYIAAPVLDNGRVIGVVSVGKPKLNLTYFVAKAQAELYLAGLIVFAVSLALGLGLYIWISRPLEQLTQYALKVKSGERAVMPKFGDDEIGTMARAMDEMRVALEGKDYVERYVQSLTHEIKSPLAGIRSAAELLKEDLPPQQRERFLENIEEDIARLQALIDRLLQLASIEKQTHIEHPEVVDIQDLVNEVVESQQPLMISRGIEVQAQVQSGTKWRGSRFLLRQAVENLIRNALDFSAENSTVNISAAAESGNATLNIRDHGTGIPDYASPRVFERFYSLPRPSGSKGTGLGLNFAMEIVKLHGGDLKVTNHVGGGVEASIRLRST